MKKAACFAVLALCAQAQAHTLKDLLDFKVYPEATPAELKAVADYTHTYAYAGNYAWHARRIIEDPADINPAILPTHSESRLRVGKISTSYREFVAHIGPYGERAECTYPHGGAWAELDADDLTNFALVAVELGAEFSCITDSWKLHMSSDGRGEWQRRFDSWAAISAHWKYVNAAVIDSAKHSGGWIIAIADAVVNYPLFGVPLMAGLAWLARRQWRRRVAEEKQAKEEQAQ